MFLRIILYSFLLSCSFGVSAQEVEAENINQPKSELSVLSGIHFWRNSLWAEVGLAKYYKGVSQHHPVSYAYYLSSEVNLLTGKDFIIGPKIGAFVSGGAGALSLGLNLIYYTDFHDSETVFRPEIGVGVHRVRLAYGYNISLSKEKLNGVVRNNIGIIYLLK